MSRSTNVYHEVYNSVKVGNITIRNTTFAVFLPHAEKGLKKFCEDFVHRRASH
jgi:hypothetical protein